MSGLREPQGAHNERYTMIAQLGHGGMGNVYLAVQRGIGEFLRLSVIKRLRDDISLDRECVAMFLEEARLAARLCHPNIVHTYEAGVDNRQHFIAMEYLNGMNFEDAVLHVGSGKFDFAIALRILIDTLSGLEYAHNLSDFDGKPMQLVHRDMSPPNIFLSSDGQVKVLDFGIAKALGSAVHTKLGSLKGKIPYMAPEQAGGRTVDARADLYAVGVMLWEAAAGRSRWGDFGDISLLKKVSAPAAFVSPNAAGRGLPARTEEICARALAYDPNDRFQTAGEFRAALEGLLQDMGRRVSSRDVAEYLAPYIQKHTRWLQPIISAALKTEQPSIASIRAVTFEVAQSSPTRREAKGSNRKPKSAAGKRSLAFAANGLAAKLDRRLRDLPVQLRRLPVQLGRLPVQLRALSAQLAGLPAQLREVPARLRALANQRVLIGAACALVLGLVVHRLSSAPRTDLPSAAAPRLAAAMQPPRTQVQPITEIAAPSEPATEVADVRTVTPDELSLDSKSNKKKKSKAKANPSARRPTAAASYRAKPTNVTTKAQQKGPPIRLDVQSPW
jgi:serine/threonine protein kinase